MAKDNRVAALDGLRGIFAFTVMCGHFVLLANNQKGDAFQNIALCVQFFFILSGFSLCFGLEERMRSGRISTLNFARQRFMRIYPMHIVAMVAAGFFMWPLWGKLVTSADNFAWVTILNLLLLQCVGLTNYWSWNIVSWSISTEFWVGLAVLPFAFRFLPTRIAFILSFLGYALLFLTQGTVLHQYAFVVPGLTSGVLSTAAGLLMGIVLCRIARAKKGGGIAIHIRKWATIVGLLEFGLLASILYITYLSQHGALEFFCIALMPPVLLSVAVSDSWMAKLLGSVPFRFLGEISYSMYLLHIPILGALTYLGIAKIEDLPGRFVVFASAVLIISTAAYRWLEHPVYQRFRQPSVRQSQAVQAG